MELARARNIGIAGQKEQQGKRRKVATEHIHKHTRNTNNHNIYNSKKGSLVIVTGASGFIGAHVCKVFLRNGYKVRSALQCQV